MVLNVFTFRSVGILMSQWLLMEKLLNYGSGCKVLKLSTYVNEKNRLTLTFKPIHL